MPRRGCPPSTVRVDELSELLRMILDFISIMIRMWQNDMGFLRSGCGGGGGGGGDGGGDGGGGEGGNDKKRRRMSSE